MGKKAWLVGGGVVLALGCAGVGWDYYRQVEEARRLDRALDGVASALERRDASPDSLRALRAELEEHYHDAVIMPNWWVSKEQGDLWDRVKALRDKLDGLEGAGGSSGAFPGGGASSGASTGGSGYPGGGSGSSGSGYPGGGTAERVRSVAKLSTDGDIEGLLNQQLTPEQRTALDAARRRVWADDEERLNRPEVRRLVQERDQRRRAGTYDEAERKWDEEWSRRYTTAYGGPGALVMWKRELRAILGPQAASALVWVPDPDER